MSTEETKDNTNEKKLYKITKLPKYLFIHIKRFSKNSFFKEKNPSIVNFPIKNLDMQDVIGVKG
jgi:U4/U6.U5 tri-snRNP-associated protein 2